MTKKILLVDDQKYMLTLYSRIIKSSDKFKEYEMIFADDGSTAISYLEQNDCGVIDAILFDYHMYDKNGDKFHAWLREYQPQLAGKCILVASLDQYEFTNFVEKYNIPFVEKAEHSFNDKLLGHLEKIVLKPDSDSPK